MLSTTDKYGFYEELKKILSQAGFLVTSYSDIQYGLQFNIEYQESYGVIRVYEGKKGIKLDLSQIKDKKIASYIGDLVVASDDLHHELPNKKPKQKNAPTNLFDALESEPEELVGIDESGKGDFFGPLVVGAVYVNKKSRLILQELGVQDSKKIADPKILKLAPMIKETCEHSLVIVGNQTYNELYLKFQNLNHILAWGHARVLENTLNQVECQYALSDQFANSALINGMLMRKGKGVQLFQKPRAESNIAVAAASIIARAAFLERLMDMKKAFDMEFPKGCSGKTLQAAKDFVEKNGKDYLSFVAKLHFNLTKKVTGE
jgi:ribonuclease HIII